MIERLRTIESKNFCIDVWTEDCGTVGCVAGHCRDILGFKLDEMGEMEVRGIDIMGDLSKVLELDDFNTERIFHPNSYDRENFFNRDEVRSRNLFEAVRRLEGLIK